jgi:nitroreductase
MNLTDELRSILELARGAPSGDNVQSWEFEIAGPRHVVIHTRDTRRDTVYDLRGRPSQLAYGCLIETLAIAASAHGLRADVTRRPPPTDDEKNDIQVFDVRLEPDPAVKPDPLIRVIDTRSVQRRPLSKRPLTTAEKAALQASVAPGYIVTWYETGAERWAAAKLMYKNAKLRLTMPEAYLVHKHIIDWAPGHENRSETLVPPNALGVDQLTLKLMKWAMASWERMSTMNSVFGTWGARMQMDLLPGVACAAHYVIRADKAPQTVEDYVAAGRAVQRFWLTLTSLGLQMQPEMTPLIFSRYVEEGIEFTAEKKLMPLAIELREETNRLLGKKPGDPFREVYMGRLGAGPAASARSERKPLRDLIRQ